jgi:DNA replication protein DnaC
VKGGASVTVGLRSRAVVSYPGDRMTAAIMDRLTHRCEIFEMNGESYRFRESMKAKK